MTDSDVWDAATAAVYDAEAAQMFAPEVLGPTVDFLYDLANGGPVLELAIGTGRIGVELVRRGLAVIGIELSEPMVAILRSKVSEQELPIVIGDMSQVRAGENFSLAFVAWNSIANLTTQDSQVACFENAAAQLRTGGHFVIELLVPPLRRLPPGQSAVPFDVSPEHTGFDTFDLVTQQAQSHHFTRQPDGTYRYDVGHFRNIWPAECDLMARIAGLEFVARYADWQRRPFTAESESHVSVWRKPTS